jgi:hypothetical protein
LSGLGCLAKAIGCPLFRIVDNVVVDRGPCLLISDDMFVVVALPNGWIWGLAGEVDLAGDRGFEAGDEGGERSGGHVGLGS